MCKETEGVTSTEEIKVRALEMESTKNFLNSQRDLCNISHKIICRLKNHGHSFVSRDSAQLHCALCSVYKASLPQDQ